LGAICLDPNSCLCLHIHKFAYGELQIFIEYKKEEDVSYL